MQIRATDPQATQYKTVDNNTGEKLNFIAFADDQTGEYHQIETDASGNPLTENGQLKITINYGNIKIVPAKQLLIYVAGPYTANSRSQVKKNIAMAEAIGEQILAAGHIPIIPHKITSFWDEREAFKHWQNQDWLHRFCLPLLDRCDGAFFIPGWELSEGAIIEYHHTAATRKPQYFSIEALCGPR